MYYCSLCAIDMIVFSWLLSFSFSIVSVVARNPMARPRSPFSVIINERVTSQSVIARSAKVLNNLGGNDSQRLQVQTDETLVIPEPSHMFRTSSAMLCKGRKTVLCHYKKFPFVST